MRRSLVPFAVAAVFLAGAVASAQEGGESSAPVTVAEGGDSSSSSSGEGGGALRASGAFFDKNDTTHRKLMLSFFLELPWGYYFAGGFGFGVGARFAIPIVKGGFVPQINDSFWIEFGADTGYYFHPLGFSFGLTIPAQAMYMVHLLKNFAVYAKVSFGIHFQAYSYSYCGVGAPCATFWPFFHGAGGVGLVYNLSDNFALRAEVMSSGFYGGIAFQF